MTEEAKLEKRKVLMVPYGYVHFLLRRVHDNRIKAWKNKSLKEKMNDVLKNFDSSAKYVEL